MSKQSQIEAKQVINQAFGFQQKQIVLLEMSGTSKDTFDYIMFRVCGIDYQIRKQWDIITTDAGKCESVKRWHLRIFDGGDIVDKYLRY